MPYTVTSEKSRKKVTISNKDWSDLLGKAYDNGWRPSVAEADWKDPRTAVLVTYESSMNIEDADATSLSEFVTDPELKEVLKEGSISLL